MSQPMRITDTSDAESMGAIQGVGWVYQLMLALSNQTVSQP
jgi:hypothetical protein